MPNGFLPRPAPPAHPRPAASMRLYVDLYFPPFFLPLPDYYARLVRLAIERALATSAPTPDGVHVTAHADSDSVTIHHQPEDGPGET